MAKTIMMGGSANNSTSVANTTAYVLPVGNNTNDTTEANAQLLIKKAGTCQDLGVRISANSVAGTTIFTFRKNGAAGNQTVSVGSSATGWFEDTTNTDTVVSGDLICVKYVPGAATNTFTLNQIKMEFDTNVSTTSTTTVMGCVQAGGNTGYTGASTTYVFQINSAIPTGSTTQTTESAAQWKEQYSGTFKNLRIKVSANSRSTTSTARFRKNGANGNQAAVVTASTTGWFEDTTNTDTVAANDLINYSLVTGTGTSAQTLRGIVCDFETTSDPGVGHLGAGYATPATSAGATTNNIPITGRYAQTLATESTSQVTLHDAYKFKGLTVGVTANTVTGTSTVKLRVNGANSALSASITASTTGTFTDLSNTVTIADGDLVNFQLVTTGAGGNSMTVPYINCWTEIAGVVTGPTQSKSLSESVTITSAVVDLRGRLTTTSGSIALTATHVPLRGRWRTTSGSLALVAAHAYLRNKVRTLSDSLTMSDSNARVRGRWRTLADSFALTAPLAKLTTRLRTLAPSLTIADTYARLRFRPKTLSDSVALSDSYARLRLKLKTTSDSIAISAAHVILRNKNRTLADSVALAATHARLRGLVRALTPSLTLADSYSYLRGKLKTLSNSIALADSYNRVRGRWRTVSDSLGLSDSLTKLTTRLRTLNHSLAFVDAYARLRLRLKTLSDSITFADSLTRLTTRLRTVSESLTFVDTLQKVRGLVKSLSDSVVLSSTLAKLTTRIRELSHSLSITDILETGGEIVRPLTQNLGFSVGFSYSRAIKRVLSDTVSILSNTVKTASKTRILADSIAISSLTQSLKGGFSRLLNHTLALDATINRGTTRIRVILESLVISDLFNRFKGLIRGMPTQSFTLFDDIMKISGTARTLDESGLGFSASITNMHTRIRILNAVVTIIAVTARLTTRTRGFADTRTLSSTVASIKGGVGTGVLATTAFVKHLTNKFIFKR